VNKTISSCSIDRDTIQAVGRTISLSMQLLILDGRALYLSKKPAVNLILEARSAFCFKLIAPVSAPNKVSSRAQDSYWKYPFSCN
jgi:hypothetical protein